MVQKGAVLTKMKVNGEIINLETPAPLSDFVAQQGYRTERIAVELNGDIIPKSAYTTTIVTDADTLEIVHFVGGG